MTVIRVPKSAVSERLKSRGEKIDNAMVTTNKVKKYRKDLPTDILMKGNRSPGYIYK